MHYVLKSEWEFSICKYETPIKVFEFEKLVKQGQWHA